MTVRLLHGDCRELLARLDADSVDAIVTDPPYGLEFMGKEWDRLATPKPGNIGGFADGNKPSFERVKRHLPEMQHWHESWAREVYRVLKPGAHLLAFGGTRTFHRLTCALEDAGFEIRDCLSWLYGSGFPKSLDVGKAMDKVRDRSKLTALSSEIKRAREESGLSLKAIGEAMQAATDGQYGAWYHRGGHMFFETGMSLPSRPEWEHLRQVLPIAAEFEDVYAAAERDVVGQHASVPGMTKDKGWNNGPFSRGEAGNITAPATDLARQWDGWGTALKPGHEIIVWGQKPYGLSDTLGIMALNIGGLLCQLASSANDAVLRLRSNPSDYEEAFDSALLPVVQPCNTPDALLALTDTWQFVSEPTSSLSIVWSWLSILADLSKRESTFTTATATALITDLKTCNSLLSTTTAESITQDVTRPSGDVSIAWSVDALLRSVLVKSLLTPTTSADAPAIEKADASGLRPDAELICLARKPLIGTVAANVERYGTGALNIDGCRIETSDHYAYDRRGGSPIHGGGQDINTPAESNPLGRWPANVALDEDAAATLDASVAPSVSRIGQPRKSAQPGNGYGMTHTGAEYADSGGPSRFFFVAQSDTISAWNTGNASTAEPSSSPRSRPDDSAPSDAATSANHAATRSNGSTAPSTNATPSESSSGCGSATPATPNTELKFWQEFRPTSTSNPDHVNDAARPTPTGTTTTTDDRLTCDSFAGPATSKNTLPPLERGEADSPELLRFKYCAKASRSERNAGLEGMPERETRGNYGNGIQDNRPHTPDGYVYQSTTKNVHPCVKPVALMRWLVRLITPPGGIVLDPFMGSGTTGIACVHEGVDFMGIEQDAEYLAIAERRIAHAQGPLFATMRSV